MGEMEKRWSKMSQGAKMTPRRTKNEANMNKERGNVNLLVLR